jgi:hypothetical protein
MNDESDRFPNRTTDPIEFPSNDVKDLPPPVLREGARRMLALAVEAEVAEWLDRRSSLVDAALGLLGAVVKGRRGRRHASSAAGCARRPTS